MKFELWSCSLGPSLMNILKPASAARLERLFIDQAAISPDAPAIFFRGETISYGELNSATELLATDLTREGVGPGVIVAISLQRTPSIIAVLLGVLRAGGAYLPLDARSPPERTHFMLSDSACTLAVTDKGSPELSAFQGNILELRKGRLVRRRGTVVPAPSGPVELAYVIYTSGSTGVPKGVMLGHGATGLVDWARGAYSADELSRVAATTSICFDPSIFEIFAPLSTGGAIVLKENALRPFEAEEQPSLLVTVPSVLAELCRADAVPASVRVLTVGGEAVTADLVREVYRRHPDLTVQNHYGPTEATTCATVADLPRDLVGLPPIGRPVRGASVVLLDDRGVEVAEGETGEIHIGGPGLALGYINRPALNSSAFIEGPTGRAYRTGDLARWRDGQLYFAGRRDQQVKIRGFRVELGEVEASLIKIPGVEEALALVPDGTNRPQINAYIRSNQSLTKDEVRKALAAWLPDYMLPTRVIILDAFPRLPSGKVDHSALPEPMHEPVAAGFEASALEKAIIFVFQEVLTGAQFTPDDSFFDLGGDSLASVQAALRLSEVLGFELPAALIHQAPTPCALASALGHAQIRAVGHISLLAPGGSAPPLFCIADLFGHAFNYLSLARRLGGERAVYGVTPGPLQEAFARDGDIKALTQAFSLEIRSAWPQGPYEIAGYSAGGLLALEVACALEREGQDVRLVLLDSRLPSGGLSAGNMGRWGLKQVRRLFQGSRRGGRIQGLRTALSKLPQRMIPATAPPWIPWSQVAFATRMMRVSAAYRPERFCGRSLLIRASGEAGSAEGPVPDGFMGWSDALRGPVVRTSVAGGHHEFLREPLVAESALAVRAFLIGAAPVDIN